MVVNKKDNYGTLGIFMGTKVIVFSGKDNGLYLNNFSEVVALYEFDSNVKTLFYKHVMFAETAIKNRLLEIIHVHSGT